MSQIRRQEKHAAIRAEIKNTARKLMAAHGTAGLGMRAISREMDLTAPAIYHYYPSRDALITDLILDAFNALGEAMEQARDSAAREPVKQQIMAAILAYRDWALAHPIDFQLIYGNPIPGYTAPEDITAPAAERPYRLMINLISSALKQITTSRPSIPSRVPVGLEGQMAILARLYGADDDPDLALAAYLTLIGWSRIHGIIMLELFNHIQPVVGDTETFYRLQAESMLNEFGLDR